jgi:hypothetical protein
MIKFGLKPAMTMSLADSDNPVEQLNTIIDFAKAARMPASILSGRGSTTSAAIEYVGKLSPF